MPETVFGSGEFHTTDPRVGTIRLSTDGREKELYCSMIDGHAVFEGDIIIATPLEPWGIAITGAGYRWPEKTVVYAISDALPRASRVYDAIAHWEANTPIRFRKRTSENDYVLFRRSSGCASAIGKRGGTQFVNLGDQCETGNTVHELGHTVGLWHEQSREDRDGFVTIHWENIIDKAKHNFDQKVADGDDIGEYDYGSIMHYPPTAFAKDKAKPTISAVDGSSIGQRDGLSDGDIQAVIEMYKDV